MAKIPLSPQLFGVFFTFLAATSASAQMKCDGIWEIGATPTARFAPVVTAAVKNVSHIMGPTTLAGVWDFAPTIKAPYMTKSGVPYAVEIQTLQGQTYLVRDLQYDLGNGKYGINIIPIVDRPGKPGTDAWKAYPPVGKTQDGVTVHGSELVDQQLREAYGVKEGDDVFAMMSHTHPDENVFVEQTKADVLVQNRTTHMGAYIGKGMTRHSPVDYAKNGGWNIGGYPINISIVKLANVKPAVLNKNINVSLTLLNALNGGVQFPKDYKFDYFRQINLKEVLEYYRGWLDPKWERAPGEGPYVEKLKKEDSFKCYCAEHVTLAINVAMNVPHNLKGFQDAYGPEVGRQLFDLAIKGYKDITKEEMPAIEDFATLWKQKGISNPSQHTKFGDGLAWPPLTVADMIHGFMTQYVNFGRVGPVMSTLTLLNFSKEANRRMGINQQDFLKLAFPVMVKMLQFHATATLAAAPRGAAFDAAFAQYSKAIEDGFTQAFNSMGAQGTAAKAQLLPMLMGAFAQSKTWIAENPIPSMDAAHAAFEKAIVVDLDVARVFPPKLDIDTSVRENNRFVQYYSPPHMIGWLVNGIHPTDPLVNIRMLGTILDASEVNSRPTGPREIEP